MLGGARSPSVLVLNRSGARLSYPRAPVTGEYMSLVEQTIARLKKQQAKAADVSSTGRPHRAPRRGPVSLLLDETCEFCESNR